MFFRFFHSNNSFEGKIMLSFEIIKDPGEWEKLKDQWNDLLEKSITHVPFLRYEFLEQWWVTCGGGEWNKSDMFIITARDDEELVGIAPFFYKENAHSYPSLMLIGSYEISDYLDFIVLPEYLDQFLLDLFSFLTTSDVKKWQDIDLYNLLDYSPTLAAVAKASSLVGWQCDTEILQKAPYITLPGDWELYLKGIDKKQRHEIRRKMRRLAESGRPSRWYIVENADTAEAEMEAFLALMDYDE
jgi:CelD/BcsL family acetyltransferase involved in cellulose biosynthesis